MNLDINKLNITDVTCEKTKHSKKELIIKFFIDDFHYHLFAKEHSDGKYYPVNIIHWSFNSDYLHCEGLGSSCLELVKHRIKLFHRLIEHPSIRLECLYINHV